MCVSVRVSVGDEMTTFATRTQSRNDAVEACGSRRPRSSFPTTTRGLCLVCVERSGQVAHFSARCELPDHWVRTSEFGVQLEGDRRIYPPQVLPSGGHRRTYGWTELSLATISTRKYFGISHPPTARLGSFKGPLQSDRPIVLSENDLERPGRQANTARTRRPALPTVLRP